MGTRAVGRGVKGCQERRHWDDSFQMYGGTPAVVYYWESEFDEEVDSIKEPLNLLLICKLIWRGNQECKPSQWDLWLLIMSETLKALINSQVAGAKWGKVSYGFYNMKRKTECKEHCVTVEMLHSKARVRYVLARTIQKTVMSEVNSPGGRRT